MYTSHFGLRENPFNVTPDTRYLFLSRQHSEALNHLLYGINEKKGFIIITGGIGTGKTTLCRKILSLIDESTDAALILNSAVSEIELLETINQEFGIPLRAGRQSKKGYIDDLNRFLLANFTAGRNAVLLIDEAQNLAPSVLEQIRMLSNLETEREKLLQIILIGQPELEEILASPALRQLNERIPVRYTLTPLDLPQVKDYIRHRLSIAGSGDNGSVHFTHRACRLIYRYSRGIPRRINAICDRALLIAFSRGDSSINPQIVKEGTTDIGINYGGDKPGTGDGKIIRLVVLAFLIIIFSVIVMINKEPLIEFFISQTNRIG